MPPVFFDRVLSVNSEDPAHKAENLLKSNNNRKWKCKVGEKHATVILQLKESVVIEAIDVGNEQSAFVEVLVGRLSFPDDDYKVLLGASSLMTLREAKCSVNVNGVTFFKKSEFTKPTCDEKWDRVKIICTQPFNRHVQYGLSFITLHAAQDTSRTLGRFVLNDHRDYPPTMGNWFSKRKPPSAPTALGVAAAVRDASLPANIATNRKPAPKEIKPNTPKNGGVMHCLEFLWDAAPSIRDASSPANLVRGRNRKHRRKRLKQHRPKIEHSEAIRDAPSRTASKMAQQFK